MGNFSPAAIIAKLNTEVRRILALGDLKGRISARATESVSALLARIRASRSKDAATPKPAGEGDRPAKAR